MGLLEQIQSGARFTRDTVTISNTPVSGSTGAFGSTYVLLNVQVDNPCRIRLYSDSASVAIDDSRSTSSININDAVGLVVDAVINSSSYKLNFDPPIIGTTFSGSETWYNISGSNVTATFTYYPIESVYGERETLNFYATSLPSGFSELGNKTSPKSFLILSASCNFTESRLRLYSRDINLVTSTEKNRTFSTAPTDGSYIISDMLFDSASYAYKLVPILQAYNLETYPVGDNYVGFILENLSGVTRTGMTASLYIYKIEN